MQVFTITKRFTIPVGHRLSKHLGRCKNWHGHNFDIMVSVSSHELNENDMVIDFSDLKAVVQSVIDEWDHCLLLNKNDPMAQNDEFRNQFRIIAFDFDPTAEQMAKVLYRTIGLRLFERHNLIIEGITVYENENSSATYQEIDHGSYQDVSHE